MPTSLRLLGIGSRPCWLDTRTQRARASELFERWSTRKLLNPSQGVLDSQVVGLVGRISLSQYLRRATSAIRATLFGMSISALRSPKSIRRRQPGCRFCEQIAASGGPSDDWAVVAETEHLLAVPSVGALVPGWLLVLPKDHHLNFASAVGASSTIESELAVIAADWENRFGPLTWFEHGPKDAGSDVGCSIDHAHMHLVPLGNINLLPAAEAFLPTIHFEPIGELSEVKRAISEDRSYLYLQLPSNTHWLASSNRIPSQSLRRVIAAEQGRGGEWDWKQFPRHDLLRETISQATSLR